MESLFTCWLDLSMPTLLLAFGHKDEEVTKPAVWLRYGFSLWCGAWSGDRQTLLRTRQPCLLRGIGWGFQQQRWSESTKPGCPGPSQASCFPVWETVLWKPHRLQKAQASDSGMGLEVAAQSVKSRSTLWPHGLKHALSLSWRLLELVSLNRWCYLTICCPLLLLPLIFPSIRIFSNGFTLCILWSKYWSLLTLSMCHILAESKGLRSQSM